jgi:hypothetical protein
MSDIIATPIKSSEYMMRIDVNEGMNKDNMYPGNI